MRGADDGPTAPEDITAAAVDSFERTPDARLRFLLQRLVQHVHAYAVETRLSPDEWAAAIAFLTAAGQACTDNRQELILLSDTLGLSMVMDAVNGVAPPGVTESTVLGPFYVPGSPERPMGASIVAQDGSGEPMRVSGTVRDSEGLPIGGATIDVWQNAGNRKYAVQDPGQPPDNLRGRFHTGTDGGFSFWSVRPTDYPIPDDGPVGRMLAAAGRHPWRPAHVHLMVSAPGYRTLTTHFFDAASHYLDSDAVFGVKPSLVSELVGHGDGDEVTWYSLDRDLVLAPAADSPAR